MHQVFGGVIASWFMVLGVAGAALAAEPAPAEELVKPELRPAGTVTVSGDEMKRKVAKLPGVELAGDTVVAKAGFGLYVDKRNRLIITRGPDLQPRVSIATKLPGGGTMYTLCDCKAGKDDCQLYENKATGDWKCTGTCECGISVTIVHQDAGMISW